MLRSWVKDGMFLINNVVLAFLTFGIYFSYTGNRFNDDFNFMYDYSPNKIWLYLLAPMPYYTSVTAIATLVTEFQIKLRMKYSKNSQSYFVFGMILVIVTSIIIISKIVHHLIMKQVENITAIHRDWGPFNEQLKNLRRLYFSNRDVRRRQIIPSCSHKCLINSKAYHRMQERQYKRLLMFEAEQEENDTYL
ncbi:PREDICTED: uncharacterized protein LOC108567298 [Nicrophorus vespilloides]|uniref:Uncharacterized protein LOC108567298 n=1 Tax=Nicrophorus vespilloides TaxID=110193 RepID=A0ABM1N8K9_NICVS|nr:PREDICTED: uncharacterized protein LOC108567298 [Nicrophorus vespilloides]